MQQFVVDYGQVPLLQAPTHVPTSTPKKRKKAESYGTDWISIGGVLVQLERMRAIRDTNALLPDAYKVLYRPRPEGYRPVLASDFTPLHYNMSTSPTEMSMAISRVQVAVRFRLHKEPDDPCPLDFRTPSVTQLLYTFDRTIDGHDNFMEACVGGVDFKCVYHDKDRTLSLLHLERWVTQPDLANAGYDAVRRESQPEDLLPPFADVLC